MVSGTILAPGLVERERILEELRQAAPRLRARGITHLSLFGSMARGEAGPRSDVDLLIEVDRNSRFSLFDLVDLQDDLLELLGRPAHFAFATKLRPWLHEEIRAEAISIF
jgi:predicted nucleotidyltransferase